jgi:cell division protein ZapE
MAGRVLQSYEVRLAGCNAEGGAVLPDPAQRRVVELLDVLAGNLELEATQRAGMFSRWRKSMPIPPRGLYIHGGVGRGKTMLMDLFFEAVPIAAKRRMHFHAFMAEAHERIGLARQSMEGDALPSVASAIAADAHLLCFDELFVNDIADAMVLGRLFRGLFERGVIVVATSNVPPDGLYRNGLNRQLFLPFIDEIEDRLDVVELVSARDFRLEKLSGQRLYFSPADDAAAQSLDQQWVRLTGQLRGLPVALTVKGHQLSVPQAAMGVARFTFADLCDAPLGAVDYLALAREFHTIFVEHIPILDRGRRDVARRFITLIDTLYDNRVCLIASAEGVPDALYPSGEGSDHFARTASRLMEMRSDAFLAGRSHRDQRK